MQSCLEVKAQQPNPSCKQNCKSVPVIHLVFGKTLFMIPSRAGLELWLLQTGNSPALAQWLQHEGCFSQAYERKPDGLQRCSRCTKGMQERSWSHRSGKKNYGGRHISANLINVPAPVNSNAKRFLTVETTWLRRKEEPGKLRINLGILQCLLLKILQCLLYTILLLNDHWHC